LQNYLNIKPSTGAGNLAGAVAGGAAGGAAAEFLRGGGPASGTRPAAGQRPAAADRLSASQRPAGGDRSLSNNRANRVENRQQLQENRGQRRDELRNQVEENHPRLDFWTDHPRWAARRITRPYRWATWGALGGWVGYGGDYYPYDYGESVYYEDGSVYSGDAVVATEEEYAQQAEAIAESAPEVADDQADWLPLGVFAMTPDGQASGPDPSLFLQLAISKEGIIRGTLHNSADNTSQDVEGMTDKESQRCAWNVVDKTRPIMETGLGNLTKDTCPALIHFADGQTQQWLMVRLEEPGAPQQ
jgi:hypothetical protein